ncbi:MAG: AMP-binding protein [Desulfobacterales bacterium]|nr:AMP-binding protein [Desulfobacterales bacterium]
MDRGRSPSTMRATREHIDQRTLAAFSKHTFPQVLAIQAKRWGTARVAIREKAYGIWEPYTWHAYLQYVKHVALGLLSLGLKRGEHVGIITDNHAEWLFSELGAQSVGAHTLNLYTSSVTKELAFGLNRIQAAYVVVQDQEQVDKLLEAHKELVHVRRVIYIDRTGMRTYRNNPWLLSFVQLLELGKALERKEPGRFEEELGKGKADDLALMIMTSGTMGLPKFAMLSYQNIIDMARKWLETSPIGVGDNWVSITPPAWIVDQMWGMGVALCGGMVMNFPETPKTMAEDLREVGPAIMITSSRFWEDLASKIRVKMRDAGFVKRWLYYLCQRIGELVVDRESAKKSIPLWLRFLNLMASWIVYRPLLDRVGCSRVRAAITGGHPVSPDVIRFFRAIGLNLKHAYGLTETGGVFQVQPDGEVKPETVGKSLPRTKVRIADDQEVLVSSPSNFMGYFQDPKETAATLIDGCLHTGDAGYFDADGHLVIIGRKHEIMRTKEGEVFSPDFIETRLKFSPFIKEAVIYGEGMPYIAAIININMETVGDWAEDRQIPYTTYTDLSQQPAVEQLICTEVRAVNEHLPAHMRICKLLLLYKLLDADDQELTRTGKVRRKYIYEHYHNLIEAMYKDRKTLAVKGKVRYRDGHVGTIETTVRILTLR